MISAWSPRCRRGCLDGFCGELWADEDELRLVLLDEGVGALDGGGGADEVIAVIFFEEAGDGGACEGAGLDEDHFFGAHSSLRQVLCPTRDNPFTPLAVSLLPRKMRPPIFVIFFAFLIIFSCVSFSK